MNKDIKPLPDFKSEAEEFEFWATHDSTDYFDLSKAEVIREKNGFPNLKRRKTKVEAPLPPDLVERLKARYAVFTSEKGPVWEVVPKLWQKIWATPSSEMGGERAFLSDFEVYDERASHPQNAVVDIWVGIRTQ